MITDSNENNLDEGAREEASAETLESIYQNLTYSEESGKTSASQNRQYESGQAATKEGITTLHTIDTTSSDSGPTKKEE